MEHNNTGLGLNWDLGDDCWCMYQGIVGDGGGDL